MEGSTHKRSMPLPASILPKKAKLFDGNGVNTFLSSYNRLGDMWDATEVSRALCLEYWCNDTIARYLRGLDAYKEKSWQKLQDILKETFPDDYEEGKQYTVSQLKAYAAERPAIESLGQFCGYYVGYATMSNPLVKRSLLTERDAGGYFVAGLSDYLRRELVKEAVKLRLARKASPATTPESAESSTKLDLLEVDKADPDKDYPELEDLRKAGLAYFQKDKFFGEHVEALNPNSEENVQEKDYELLPAAAVKATTGVKGVSPDYSDEVMSLTRQMEQLRIQIAQLSVVPASSRANQYPARASYANEGRQQSVPATGANAVPIGGQASTKDLPPCIYDGCAGPKKDCEALRQDIEAGIVKLNQKAHLLFPDGTSVPFKPRQMRELVLARAGESSPAQVSVIQCLDWDPPEVSQHDKVYVMREAPPLDDYHYYVEEKHSRDQDETDRANGQRDPKRRAPARGNTPGNPRPTARFEEPENNDNTGRETSVSQHDEDETMTEDESRRAPNVSRYGRRPGSQLWAGVDSELREQNIEATHFVADSILNANISVPAKTLLSLSKPVADAIIERSRKRRVPIPTTAPRSVSPEIIRTSETVNSAGITRSYNASSLYDHFDGDEEVRPFVRVRLSSLKCRIGNGICKMLIDTGSEINLMDYSFYEKYCKHLPLRKLPPNRSMVIGVGGHPTPMSHEFSTRVHIGQFSLVMTFLVGPRASHNEAVAGMPFLRDVQANISCAREDTILTMATASGERFEVALIKDDEDSDSYRGPPGYARANLALAAFEEPSACFEGDRGFCFLQETYWGHSKPQVNTMYKPVGVKVRPLAVPLPEQYSIPRYFRPPLPRDPYKTPLKLPPPIFVPGGRLTEERVKLIDFGPEDFLTEMEKQLLLGVLKMHERALAFDRSEKGLLRRDYATDYEVPVVPHTPWVDRQIPIPKALMQKVTEHIQKEIEAGDLEPSFSPYVTRWFMVQKPNGGLRKVVDASSMNRVTIRDSGVPPNVQDFIQEFIGHATYALADLFSGYDQRALSVRSRDMTTIQTPLGLFRHTKLLQGATNSVAEFQRSVSWVYQPEIPQVIRPFVDDIAMKGPTSTYNNELLNPNYDVRRFVWEHAVALERLLLRTEHAGLAISGTKFTVITPALNILGNIVDAKGVKVSRKALNKIQSWKFPLKSVKELRGFLGTTGAVRQFVPKFAYHDAPLRELLQKNKVFEWTDAHTKAAKEIIKEVGEDRILVKLNYDKANPITLAVDSSNIAVGFALFQDDDDGNRMPARFDSIAFNDVESRYSQPKLELCGVYKALRRCKIHLFGRHFRLEVDAKSIVQMLNNPELPNSPMSRWLAFIKLFDLEIRHVPAKDHVLVDGLSRAEYETNDSTSLTDFQQQQDAQEGEFDDEKRWEIGSGAFESSLARLSWVPCTPYNMVATTTVEEINELQEVTHQEEGDGEEASEDAINMADWPQDWQDIGRFLLTGQMPADSTEAQRKRIRLRASQLFISGSKIYKREDSGVHKELIVHEDRQDDIVRQMHEIGHRGISAVWRLTCERFWWPGLRKTVIKMVKSCDLCQRRARDHPRPREPLHPTLDTSKIFQRVLVDVVHMGQGSGSFRYLVLARDDLSGWVEGRALRVASAATIWAFINQEIICRYGPILEAIINDNGKEFRGTVEEWISTYEIQHKRSTPYNPQAHGAIERGHPPIFEALCKLSKGRYDKWPGFLPSVLYADRITTKRTTGYSPFELVFSAAPCLPLDANLETWIYTTWKHRMTTAELLVERVKQLQRLEIQMEFAAKKLAFARKASAKYMDERMAHRMRQPLKPGDLVLVHDTALVTAFTRKMDNRWYGPFIVIAQHAKGSYFLAELDGTPRQVPIAPHRLRRYYLAPTKRLEDISWELQQPASRFDPDEHISAHHEPLGNALPNEASG